MNERVPDPVSPSAAFIDFAWRHRRLLGAVTGSVTLAALVVMLIIPVEYTAKATLLPSGGPSTGLLSAARALGAARMPSLDLGTGISESAIQVAILKSDRLADLINEDLHLDERYKSKTREARHRKWFGAMDAKPSRQGLITVSYRDRDPEFAMKVVDRILERLDEFNREYRSTSGGRVRKFLEVRLQEAGARLQQLEDSLAVVQAENRTLLLSADAQKALSLGVEMLAERLRLETETAMLRQTLGPGAPALEAKEMEIAALDRELNRLPALNSEFAGLLRSREAYEKAYVFLAAQLEEARLEEERNTTTIEVLDPPVRPEEKSWPKRSLYVLAAFVAAGAVALILARAKDLLAVLRRRVA